MAVRPEHVAAMLKAAQDHNHNAAARGWRADATTDESEAKYVALEKGATQEEKDLVQRLL